MSAIQGPLTTSSALLDAAEMWPFFGRNTTLMRASVSVYWRSTSRTASLGEASSAMHSSQCGYSCERTDSIAARSQTGSGL